MDDLRTPGAWLDDEMTEREANEAIKATSVMAELANEQDPGKIINSLAPYMNSFMHLMYSLIKSKYEVTVNDKHIFKIGRAYKNHFEDSYKKYQLLRSAERNLFM